MIKPTIGRVVWYRPAANDKFLAVAEFPKDSENEPSSGNQPLPALVCCVHSDTDINIAGFDANGDPFSRQHVYLQQDETPAAAEGDAYAEWMPYQKQKAVEEGTAVDLTATLAGEPVTEPVTEPTTETEVTGSNETPAIAG